MIEPILIHGLMSGAVYALLSLGLTLIFGVTGLVNLAHGAFFMLGAYMFAVFGSLVFQLGPIPAVILAIIFVGIIGSVIYRLIIRPVIENENAVLVATVSIALIFQQLMLLVFGPSNVRLPTFLEGATNILGVVETYSRLLTFILSLVFFVGLWMFVTKSRIGEAMIAVSQDREVAMLMGVNIERVYMLTMGISASLAAIAGIFIAGSTSGVATPLMWFHPLAISFAIVIFGGLGSIKGTIIGGFIIGFAEQTVATLVREGGILLPMVPFVIMVLFILFKPKGLFGKRREME